jgi:hypothetical protein
MAESGVVLKVKPVAVSLDLLFFRLSRDYWYDEAGARLLVGALVRNVSSIPV